ncbi:MAG: TetR/AcrR family transcriptional regulator [Chloroflexota bacterium]
MIHEEGPSRSDAMRNHRLLLDTARRLFAEHGVDAVSMTQIAQEAGVGKGTLYRNFDNKVDLCYSLLDETQRELQDTTLAHLRQHPDPCQNLRWFVAQVLDFVIDNMELLTAGTDPAQAVALDMRAHLWWRQTIRNLLNQMQYAGDVDYVSDTIYVMLHVETVRFQQVSLEYSRDRIHQGLRSLLDTLSC